MIFASRRTVQNLFLKLPGVTYQLTNSRYDFPGVKNISTTFLAERYWLKYRVPGIEFQSIPVLI
jgi:hypothetical protein